MKISFKFFLLSMPLLLLSISLNSQIKSPTDFFGFKPGSDRELFDYQTMIDYLKLLDSSSDKIRIEETGKTPMGKTIYIVFISAPENLNNLEKLRKINKNLALNPDLDNDELNKIKQEGKVFLLGTLSMHSNEVGPSQAAPLIAYELVTTADPEILQWLNDVIYMMVPCHNPDGMDMVVNHYKKYKGTKYEGSNMPGIYHKYVGHDNNRDFITLTQSDNKAIAKIYTSSWYPQVMIEKHQMMMDDVRYFVPPTHDPIAENVDEELWNWTWIFGSNMATDMTGNGLKGIAQHYLFDDYWPGSTETANWKNVIGLLTECASAQFAKPVFIEPTELSVYGKGLSEYKKSINMTSPWEGGWWRLSDIVEYERQSTLSLLKTCSIHKSALLEFRNRMCKKSVKRGQTEAPYYFILPLEQHDKDELVDLIKLLQLHNIKVEQVKTDIVINQIHFKKGDIVISLAQPYQPFIKEVMEKQVFPERHYTPGGKLIKPYDITSWSLPLHRGLKVYQIDTKIKIEVTEVTDPRSVYEAVNIQNFKGQFIILSPNINAHYKIAFNLLKQGKKVKRTKLMASVKEVSVDPGSFIIECNLITKDLNNDIYKYQIVSGNDLPENYEMQLPQIGLVETIFHDMDAGWTRWVLDQYDVEYKVLTPADLKDEKTYQELNVIIFPDVEKSILLEGKYKMKDGDYLPLYYPPEYTKGITKEGVQKLMKFINDGGIVVSWGESTELFMGDQTIVLSEKNKTKEEFQFPVKDISETLSKSGLYCPGTLINIKLLEDHPLTFGMPEAVGVFSRGKPVFKTSIPYFDMDRRVIGTFPKEDIVASGYAAKSELLENKAGIVWVKKGKGQLILMGFNPQFRGSTTASYKLLFNVLLLE